MKKIMLVLSAGLLSAGAAVAANMPAKKADAAMAPVSIDTATFVKVASGANDWEIRTSKLAEEKATSADVKEVAAGIIKDHEMAGMGLKAALEKSGKPAPAEPPMLPPKLAAQLKMLEDAPKGAEFEALYIDLQAGAHMEAVTLFRNFAGGGDDKNVQAFAKETLPKLEAHTMHVMELVQAR